MTMHLRTGTFSMLLMMVFGLAGAAFGGEVTLPENVFFYQPVASVSGQASVWINPAALPGAQTGSMLLFTQRNGRLIRDYGVATNLRTIGLAWRHIAGNDRPDLDEYIFALGVGQRNRLGISYRYIKNGPGYLNHRHLWTVGFLSRANSQFSLGARVENINRTRIEGAKSDIRFVYGAAYRLYQDIVTASFDVDMTNKESFRRADYRTGVEVRPAPGIYLYADVTNHSRFQLGFRMNFGASFAGHYHYFDRDLRSLTGTSYIGTVKGSQPSSIHPMRKTLVVRLDGELPENPPIPFFGAKPLRFFDYLDGIYRAADDDAVERMFVHIGTLRCGLGKAEELAGAVAAFRDHRKPVAVFLDNPDNLSYFVAAGADSIYMPPVSELRLVGLRAELTSYKGLLDKLGVEAEVERIGDYKTAPEQYILDRPSEPNREQINRILDGLFGEVTTAIAQGRGLEVDSVKVLIDAAPLTSVEACRTGLVDRSCYFEEAMDAFTRRGPFSFSKEIGLREYASQEIVPDSWTPPAKVAVIVAEGDIDSGRSGGRVGEDELLGEIDQIRRDPGIAAVVLRVNSPGGEVIASDLLRHEIDRLAGEKPLVVSMGDVAASGGYYISAVGCPILVNNGTITGSIGVYAGKANLASLYNKLNIYSETFLRGRNAGMYSMTQPYTPEQREKLRTEIEAFYQHFISLVASSRTLTTERVDALGRGRVWTGLEASANGLADRTGGLIEAVAEARRAGGIDDKVFTVEIRPDKHTWWENPFDLSRLVQQVTRRIFGRAGSGFSWPEIPDGRLYCRLPYDITIH